MSVTHIIIPFDEELLPVKKLGSGDVTCFYENGNLRYLRISGIEFLRLIYFAVRDEQWATANYTIENEHIEEKENGFSIAYTAIHRLEEISYKADVKIEGDANSISYTVRGEALSSFKKNRIGICLLHPVRAFAGRNATITRPDGSSYSRSFPDQISPAQPFKDITKLECELTGCLNLSISFEGDVFEIEDQRNWADSTYKTYSTPLDIPFPVPVNKGEVLNQKISIKISGQEKLGEDPANKKQEQKFAFPKIGYARVKGQQLTENEIGLLLQLPFNHYRVESFLADHDWQQELKKGVAEAKKLGAKLELIVFFSADLRKEISSLTVALRNSEPGIFESILPLQLPGKTTTDALLESVASVLKKEIPGIKIGYGSDGFFAELNRNRPGNDLFDFVSFTLNPQVHAVDTRSVIENLEQQAVLVRTAKSFAGVKPVRVSPVTFKTRAEGFADNDLAPGFDERLHRSFGAAWTLHTIRNLSEADSITLYQVTGPKGILENNSTEKQYSLFSVLKKIKDFNPEWITSEDFSAGLSYENVILENEAGDKMVFHVPLPLGENG